MHTIDSDLLQKLESLSFRMETMRTRAGDAHTKDKAECALTCLLALTDHVLHERPIFGIEPWHALSEETRAHAPGEMLLRVKDPHGKPLPPYPAIMAFYEAGLASEIDGILLLCALHQFEQSDEHQVSVNIASQTLKDREFMRMALERLEQMNLCAEQRIIFEIHESAPHLDIDIEIGEKLHQAGVGIAIDDVEADMGNVFRLSNFEKIADFIKLDRKTVDMSGPDTKRLDQAMALITTILPNTMIVAEGIQNADHALKARDAYPTIQYAQGLYLPPREIFTREWQNLAQEKELA